MRAALPIVLALMLAIPATAVFAFPEAAPDVAEPLRVPASSEPARESSGGHSGHPTGGEDAAPSHTGHHAAASDAEHTHARERTAWPTAEGEIPTSTEGLVEVRNLLIEGKPDFEELEELGVEIQGSGTLADPYVLEGLWVRGELEIKDTADYYVVRGNVIDGVLRLNWNDDRVHVHHNAVRDLRVNENIERTGEATGGLIELNTFGVVGQIRHFDGAFRANEVGPIPTGVFDDIIEDTGAFTPFFAEPRAMNIDGFDGAIFEGNTILGYVEMQLHGHHHASCFDCHSHNHATSSNAMKHDHTIRYHEADFVGNTILVEDGVAFRYTDAAHSGDDRTARSEPNEDLELPHVHYTRLVIADNVVEGGPMVVDILNADSRDHENEETEKVEKVAVHATHAYRADLLMRGNSVTWTIPEDPLTVPWLAEDIRDGILVREVKEANVRIVDNVVLLQGATGPGAFAGLPLFGLFGPADAPAALHLQGVRSAHLDVAQNALEGAHFGVLAREFAEDATWTEEGNDISARQDVEADKGAQPS